MRWSKQPVVLLDTAIMAEHERFGHAAREPHPAFLDKNKPFLLLLR